MDNALELSSRLLVLLRREQGGMADFLVALSDFDRRRLWVGMGYTSLFYYLRRELKLSSGAAFLRKTAAELLQRFPEVEAPLRDGRLCISSVCELAKVITAENRAEVLPRFFHASKNEAKAVAAEIAPREAVPQRVVVTAVAALALPSRAAATVSVAPAPASSPTLELGQSLLPGETLAVNAAPAAGGTVPLLAPPPPPAAQRQRPSLHLRATHGEPPPAPRDGVEGVHAQARGREGRPLPLPPGSRRGGHPRGGARPSPRTGGEAEGAGEAASQGRGRGSTFALGAGVALHPGRSEAAGLAPGRGEVRLADLRRRRLRLDPSSAVRPHRAGRARREVDRR